MLLYHDPLQYSEPLSGCRGCIVLKGKTEADKKAHAELEDRTKMLGELGAPEGHTDLGAPYRNPLSS